LYSGEALPHAAIVAEWSMTTEAEPSRKEEVLWKHKTIK
jgi:hypothetical protein